MELKALLTVFVTIFLAELGDKTQLATLLYASDKDVAKLTVFLGASLALIAARLQTIVDFPTPPLEFAQTIIIR